MTLQTWADNGSGGATTGTQNNLTLSVTNNSNNSEAYRFTANTKDTTVTAGQRKTWTMSLREPSNEYRYGRFLAFADPTIYIRKPAGVEIYSGDVTVKKISGASVPFTVDEYTTAKGAQIIAIHITTKI